MQPKREKRSSLADSVSRTSSGHTAGGPAGFRAVTPSVIATETADPRTEAKAGHESETSALGTKAELATKGKEKEAGCLYLCYSNHPSSKANGGRRHPVHKTREP